MKGFRLQHLEWRVLLPVLLLTGMGLLTLYSAGRGTVQGGLWLKQAAWSAVGLALMAYLSTVTPSRLFRGSLVAYGLGILALAAVLVAGKKLGGAQRWLLVGPVTLQPSELMKWLALLFVSHRLGARPPEQLSLPDIAGLVGLVAFPMLLVMKQPDLGMALSFLPILLLIPLLRGVKVRSLVIAAALVPLVGVFAWKKVLRPYQKQRIETFLDPGRDLQGKGYQINQSRIAIGSGGILGKGFTSGSQTQLNFLPVKTTDFVFAVWAEERGYLGVVLALGLFGALLLAILGIAQSARSLAELCFCAGTVGILGMHLFVNVGMVAGALPNKGIALPFFSYGGSSTLSFFLALGVVMAIARQAKMK